MKYKKNFRPIFCLNLTKFRKHIDKVLKKFENIKKKIFTILKKKIDHIFRTLDEIQNIFYTKFFLI